MDLQHKKGDHAIKRGELLGREVEMTYAGALSFLRRRYTRQIEGADIVVTGIPYDGATTHRPGARLGPAAIRAASVQLAELKAFPFGFDPFDHLAVADAGDCFINPHQPDAVADTITEHAKTILQSGAKMLSFGGDHFVSYPLLRAHAERFGPVALLQFDAHSDTWSDDGQCMDHGTMFARAAKEGIIDTEHSLQIGIRSHNDDDYGLKTLDAPWVHQAGVAACIEQILAHCGDKAVYLSFDIDCLDPAFAPGTGTPVPGGLASWQALAILRGLGALNFVGMDLVEVAPAYDHAEITALAAATIAHDWLCLMAQKQGAKP